jgi:hypothetical protein
MYSLYKPVNVETEGRPWKRCKIQNRRVCIYNIVKENKKDEEEEEEHLDYEEASFM